MTMGNIIRKTWPVLLGVVLGLAIGHACEVRAHHPSPGTEPDPDDAAVHPVRVLSCNADGCLIIPEGGESPVFIQGPGGGGGIAH